MATIGQICAPRSLWSGPAGQLAPSLSQFLVVSKQTERLSLELLHFERAAFKWLAAS